MTAYVAVKERTANNRPRRYSTERLTSTDAEMSACWICAAISVAPANRLANHKENPADAGCFPKCDTYRYTQRFYRLRSEEHTSEIQSLMRISYAVFCL